MTYSQVLEYLYSQLPVYQNKGASAINYKLDKIIAICDLLGNPQENLKTIHVAGTNGKGSTSHFIASLLQTNGYKVGLYTSPHLKSFTERVRINGVDMPESAVVDFVMQHKEIIEELKPSFFEWTVALAFYYFEQQKVDFAVIEVGMGGRLDSTNIITPLVSVITNIGLDHQQFLGTTIVQIAREKAGIIKPNVPVIISETQAETTSVFREFAVKNNTKIKWVDQSATNYLKGMDLDHFPSFLKKNAQTACHAVAELESKGYRIDYSSFYDGILHMQQTTGLKGRWQKLSSSPLVICDTGHNEDGIKQVISNIEKEQFSALHIVFGVVADKDVSKIVSLLPQSATYYWCKPSNERGLSENKLKEIGLQAQLKGECYSTVNAAIVAAKNKAQSDDMIFIGGSNFVVADIDGL